MGRVRPLYIKRAARELLERCPNKFSTDFKHNCRVLDEIVNFESNALRNRIAGYISTLQQQEKKA